MFSSKTKSILAGAALALGALFTSAASAQTFEITGDASANSFGASTFTAVFSFSDATPEPGGVPGLFENYGYDTATFTFGATSFVFTQEPIFFNEVGFANLGSGSLSASGSDLLFNSFLLLGLASGPLADTSLGNLGNLAAFDLGVTGDFLTGSQETISLSNVTNVSAIPEPATWLMMIVGFGVVGLARRRRDKTAIVTA